MISEEHFAFLAFFAVLPTKSRRGHGGFGLEGSAEIALVAESAPRHDLLNGKIGIAQIALCGGQSAKHQIFDGRIARGLLEQMRKI